MSKSDILNRIKSGIKEKFDMPSLDDIESVVFSNPLEKFISMTEAVGGKTVELAEGENIDAVLKRLFPEAKTIASNLKEVSCATLDPDTVENAIDLNGTDVGVIRGEFGVAENACVWIPQTMKEKAVCFISENLVILLRKENIVSNMHEAYKRISFNDYGYGTFISGPSKTADIAQVLVMGAQAARSVTVLLLP